MYKTAVIGDRDSIICFMSLGFSVFEAENAEDAAKTLHSIASHGSFAVIFITEDIASKIADDIARYKDAALPAITVIPSKRGSAGMGSESMRDAVIRAVGADIIFND